jgi:hypothetical protein
MVDFTPLAFDLKAKGVEKLLLKITKHIANQKSMWNQVPAGYHLLFDREVFPTQQRYDGLLVHHFGNNN